MTQHLRINFTHLGRVKDGIRRFRQPVYDDRFYPVNINYEQYSRVLHHRVHNPTGNVTIEATVKQRKPIAPPTFLQNLVAELKCRTRLLRNIFEKPNFKR